MVGQDAKLCRTMEKDKAELRAGPVRASPKQGQQISHKNTSLKP